MIKSLLRLAKLITYFFFIKKHPIASPTESSNIAPPTIPLRPSSNSSGLFNNTEFMFDAISLIDDPNARIVAPASLSEILYLKSYDIYLSLIFSIAGIKNLSQITPNPQKI